MSADLEYMRARRDRCRANGICTICTKRPAQSERTRCSECIERARHISEAGRLKRKAAKARRKQARLAEQQVDAAIATYQPLDELLDMPRNRILRQMRWFDWVTAETLFLALDVPDTLHDAKTHRRFDEAFRYLIRSGMVERREVWPREYRITPAGRAAAQRLLADYEQRLEGAA